VDITPMKEEFILWRCLHSGPLSQSNIDEYPRTEAGRCVAHRAINVPFLCKMIKTYGTCAMLARDVGQTVGFLRFYPKILNSMHGAGQLCLQQSFPAGLSERFVETEFPALADLVDKTLTVHCLMTGSPFREENPYQRRGIGTQMARELIRWARQNGWERIEATAHEGLDILYENTGDAGRSFWERLGFHVVETRTERGFPAEWLGTMREQAIGRGLDPRSIRNMYTMRLDLI